MINRDTWTRQIKDFEEEPFPPDIKEREVEIPLSLDVRRAITLIGPRRSGKTYLMFLLIKKLIEQTRNVIYLNFESPELKTAEPNDLSTFLDVYFSIYPERVREKSYFFLDEIQNVEGWESFVRSLLDKGNSVYVSGSSSKLLSKEIATQLRGRSINFEIFPLTFKEFLGFKNEFFDLTSLSTQQLSQIKKYTHEFINFGAYPEVVLTESKRLKEKILDEMVEVTIQRDVMERYKIRNEKSLRILFKALVNSREFSVHSFYNFLKSIGIRISKNTIYFYLQILEDSLVVYPLKKFSLSYKGEEQSIPKIYMVDNGILRAYGIDNESKLLENLVFTELLKRYGFKNLRYLKINQKEVDFVVMDRKKVKQLIQVCYDVEDFSTKNRELRALIKAGEELKCRNLKVITWDYEAREEFKNRKVEFTPLWRWLLEI
ncbi:MAG: ATP-binding protein [Candidatus Altiarchaeales archaeon]|nr:MAG: ATP-binding protein [Candidatus Altiarchaeales archaeon]